MRIVGDNDRRRRGFWAASVNNVASGGGGGGVRRANRSRDVACFVCGSMDGAVLFHKPARPSPCASTPIQPKCCLRRKACLILSSPSPRPPSPLHFTSIYLFPPIVHCSSPATRFSSCWRPLTPHRSPRCSNPRCDSWPPPLPQMLLSQEPYSRRAEIECFRMFYYDDAPAESTSQARFRHHLVGVSPRSRLRSSTHPLADGCT